MGLSKRSRSTCLLAALNIPRVSDIVNRDTFSLFQRIFKVPSPARDLSIFLLSQHTVLGSTVKGSLVDRVAGLGVSPLAAAVGSARARPLPDNSGEWPDAGIVDSLRFILSRGDYNNPYGRERQLVQLLTSSF